MKININAEVTGTESEVLENFDSEALGMKKLETSPIRKLKLFYEKAKLNKY